jgi:hypothetical protein
MKSNFNMGYNKKTRKFSVVFQWSCQSSVLSNQWVTFVQQSCLQLLITFATLKHVILWNEKRIRINMSTIAQKIEIIVNCNWLPRKYVVTANLLLNKVPEKKIFYWICVQTQNLQYNTYCGPGSVVGIVTAYGLDGPGIKFHWGEIFRTSPDRPWGPPSLLYNGYRVFPGGKVLPGRDADPSPPSSAEV